MGLAVIVVLGALAAGALRGGSPRRLSEIRLRRTGWVGLAVLAQLVGGIGALAGSRPVYDIGLASSAIFALGFCISNRRVAGLPLLGLGLLSNALVVTVNGSMPVSYVAAARAGANVTAIAAAEDPRHSLAGPSSRLRWLGDVIAVPLPLRAEVDSPGDLLIAAGLAEFVVAGMGRRRARRHHRLVSATRRPGDCPGDVCG